MKRNSILLMIFSIAFASNMESVAQILYNGIGYIPKEYQINWTNAGLLPENRPSGLQPETPIMADHFIVLTPGGNCDEKIQLAIDQAKQHPGISIIFFSDGVYALNSSIALRVGCYICENIFLHILNCCFHTLKPSSLVEQNNTY